MRENQDKAFTLFQLFFHRAILNGENTIEANLISFILLKQYVVKPKLHFNK